MSRAPLSRDEWNFVAKFAQGSGVDTWEQASAATRHPIMFMCTHCGRSNGPEIYGGYARSPEFCGHCGKRMRAHIPSYQELRRDVYAALAPQHCNACGMWAGYNHECPVCSCVHHEPDASGTCVRCGRYVAALDRYEGRATRCDTSRGLTPGHAVITSSQRDDVTGWITPMPTTHDEADEVTT